MRQAIEATDRVICAGRELKRSLMKHLFTYGPIPISQADQVLLTETEIGEVPVGWAIVKVGDVYNIKLGKMLSKAARKGNSPFPYLRNANVQWGYISLEDVAEMDFSNKEREKFRLRKDDILVCEGGEIGRTAIWENQLEECYYQKALHRLRPKNEVILPKYFLYYMMNIFLVKKVPVIEGARSTIAHLPADKLRLVPLALPSLLEQGQIVEILECVDKDISSEVNRKQSLEIFFNSFLHHLMTGKLRVQCV